MHRLPEEFSLKVFYFLKGIKTESHEQELLLLVSGDG
jgi:hypothetical protein